MIIGISGKSGSGKSNLAKNLADVLNYKIIDVDKLTKEIRTRYIEDIVKIVDSDEFVIDGKVDSKLLGNLLFKDDNLMNKYNQFVYSKLKIEIEKIIDKYRNIIIETMFLEIMDIFNKCDYKILVVCEEKIRRERILLRDKIDIEYLNSREKFSLDYDRNKFDLVVDTSNEDELLMEKIINKLKKANI